MLENFGLFGHLIAIYLRMGIYVWLVQFRRIHDFFVMVEGRLSVGSVMCGCWAGC